MSTGHLGVGYAPQLDVRQGSNLFNQGHNFLVGAGAFPYTEAFLRLAASELSGNCFAGNCGQLRDLALSAKFAVPANLIELPGDPLKFAAGVTDYGGAATNFRSAYLVSTYDAGPFAVSAGYAQRSGRPNAPIGGAFGSLIWQPLPWASLLAEHTGSRQDLGLRLTSPASWMPSGTKLNAELRTGVPSQPAESGHSLWWGFSATFPLGLPADVTGSEPAKLPALQVVRSEPRRVADPVPVISPGALLPPPARLSLSPAPDPVQLAQILEKEGFQDIRIGRDSDVWVIAVENQVYVRSELDAIGAILARYARWSLTQQAPVELQLYKEGQRVFTVASHTRCLVTWQDGISRCPSVLTYPEPRDPTGWIVNKRNPMAWRPRLEIAPIFNYFLGTEYGALAFNPGLAATLEVPLPVSGSLLEARYITGLYQSNDYRQGQVFAGAALPSAFNRVVLHQYHALTPQLSVHGGIGRVEGSYDGGFGEARWQNADGRHRVMFHAGEFRNPDRVEARPAVLSYRFTPENTDLAFGVRYGEFFDGDRGYLAFGQMRVSDVFLTALYRQTTGRNFGNPSETVSFAGLEINIPFTPRRVTPWHGVIVKGSNSIFLPVLTEVQNDVNRIFFDPPRGRFASVPLGLDARLMDRDRLGTHYVQRHGNRIETQFHNTLEQPDGTWQPEPVAAFAPVPDDGEAMTAPPLQTALTLQALRRAVLDRLQAGATQLEAAFPQRAQAYRHLAQDVLTWPLGASRPFARLPEQPALLGLLMPVAAPQQFPLQGLGVGLYDREGADAQRLWVLHADRRLSEVRWPLTRANSRQPWPSDAVAVFAGLDNPSGDAELEALNTDLLQLLRHWQPQYRPDTARNLP